MRECNSKTPFRPQPLQGMQNSFSIAARDSRMFRQLADSKEKSLACCTVIEGRGWKRHSNPRAVSEVGLPCSGQEGNESLSLCYRNWTCKRQPGDFLLPLGADCPKARFSKCDPNPSDHSAAIPNASKLKLQILVSESGVKERLPAECTHPQTPNTNAKSRSHFA